MKVSIVRPDAKGRVSLGKLIDTGVSSFHIYKQKGKIILEPYAEIPHREKWLYENNIARQRLEDGLRDSEHSKTKFLGDFTQYIKPDCDEEI